MTTIQYILLIFAVVSMLIGVFIIIRSIRNRKADEHSHAASYDKNGVPIVPRHQRDLIDPPDLDDTLGGETVITPNRNHLKPVITEGAQQPHTNEDIATENLDYDDYDQNNYAASGFISDTNPEGDYVVISKTASTRNRQEHLENSFVVDDDNLHRADDTEDMFTSLASATENVMPVIETAEEPEFNENSPLLDNHLFSTADAYQNRPLNHAEQNINITLIPYNPDDVIKGTTVLSLVEQYGLRYGAMNMFHRYENKDGTGLLWFSMMGIMEGGVIAPFDLNSLPTARLNGLVMFLSLPHPKALQGFDSMMSIVGLFANQANLRVLDEENDLLTRERKQQLRTLVQEYQLSHQED